MASGFARISATLVLFASAGSACQRGADTSVTGALDSPSHHLAAEYPERVRAGGEVLPGALIARGDSLYHGVIGRANCILCHGPFLKGGSHGTNLRDQRWHHGDGSYDFLVSVITSGVDEAAQSPIPGMPPMGGIPLSREEIQALAAYVYWFSTTRAASDSVSYPGGHQHEHDHAG